MWIFKSTVLGSGLQIQTSDTRIVNGDTVIRDLQSRLKIDFKFTVSVFGLQIQTSVYIK